MFDVPGVACLFGQNSDGGVTYTIIASSCILAVLAGVKLFEVVAATRGRFGGSDRADMGLSMIFILQLTFSWKLFGSTLKGVRTGGTCNAGTAWILALVLVTILLLFQVWLAANFARKIKSYQRGLAHNRWAMRSWRSFCPGWCGLIGVTEQTIAPRRLEKQVAFLTRRFANHAPTWQLVIWTRQFALFMISLIAEQMLPRLEQSNQNTFRMLRLIFAALAIVVTLAAWRHHHNRQPYYYRFQNSIEAWLYSSTVTLIALACVYSALPSQRRASGAIRATRVVMELSLLSVLLSSFIGAAVYSVYKLRAARRQLLTIDLSEVLRSADAKIDSDLIVQLAQGNIRLLRCSWLMSHDLDSSLGIDPITGCKFMPRFQDLPTDAFFSPREATALFKRGDRSVLVLSYGWNRCAPPSDPTGVTLTAVRRYLASQGTSVLELGLFWE